MNVPGIRLVDVASGILGIEWIDGMSVRYLLGGGAEDEVEAIDEEDNSPLEEPAEENLLAEYRISKGSHPINVFASPLDL